MAKALQCFSSLFYSRAKEILQRKEIPVHKNTAQLQVCAPAKKSDVELLRENGEKFKFCPSEKDLCWFLQELNFPPVLRRFVLSNRRFLCPDHQPCCFHWSPNYPSSDKKRASQRHFAFFAVIFDLETCTATEMIPTIEMISATEMTPNHHRNDPHHRNDTGGHHRNDPRNIGNGIKRTTKTGQQFSACLLFIYIASFLRCVIYLLPHFILQ